MLRNIITGLTVAALALGAAATASAQTGSTANTSSQVQLLIDQIKLLQQQLETLRQLQQQVNTAVQNVESTLKLIRNLREGVSGDDVRLLQELLASDPSVYPEGLITGYFGKLTAKAIRAYQKKHGLEQVGEVGPRTRDLIHKWLEKLEDDDDDDDLPKELRKRLKRERERHGHGPGDKDHKVTICHRTDAGGSNTISIAKSALPAHLAHGDTEGACGTQSPATTTPDTTPPLIWDVTSTSTASTSTNIFWRTNEPATSKVWYNITNPLVVSSTTPMVSSSSLVTVHSLSVTGLASSTTYYYIVVSSDAALNTATSSQFSFTTLAP